MNKVFFFILSLGVILSDRTMAQNEELLGKWELNIDKSIASFEGSSKTRYDSLSLEKKERLKTTMSGRTFHFQEAGKFSVDWKSGTQSKTSSGTWKMDAASGTVSITIEGNVTDYTYKFLDGSLMLQNIRSHGLFNILCFSRK
ncbi:MAG TPA: hypothetical protein PKK67_02555 [Cyclobacteriaceae bacterium]|nr:MAG: hypothetical protein UZ12_BCD005002197 [Bacteroidetes bacterium OLB12]HNT49440.1 hypothetical protein [Cyclobacteriaceae bacterium]